jgi:hypothetical protein
LKNKYDFLLIKGCEPTENRYYAKFSKIVINKDNDENNSVENKKD